MRRFNYLLVLSSTTVLALISFLTITDNIIQIKHQPISQLISPPEKLTTKIYDTKNQTDLNQNSYLDSYKNLLKCNLNYTTQWSPLLDSKTKTIDYTQPANETAQKYKINRAIIIYYPFEKSTFFEPEFKWLYQSWLEMQKYEPIAWRTDIILFLSSNATKNVLQFFELFNCSFENKRSSRDDKPMCRLINYVSIKDRKYENKAKFDENLYQNLFHKLNIFSSDFNELSPFYLNLKEKLKDYSYVDSILVGFDGYDEFKNRYDFLIRSDMDVFLTPFFAKWLPYNCNDFYVGAGGYSMDFNRKRLKRIAFNLGLKYANVDNLGSTWYSTPEQFRLVSYLTLVSMSYLSNEEFSPAEKTFEKPLMWPYWHYGVLLLYGQNLAMNHLIATKQLNIVKLEDSIDVSTYFDKSVNKAIHLHVFHGDELFSKFKFKNGKYDQMELIDENDEKFYQAKYYALNIALKSKRSNSSAVMEQYNEIVSQKNQILI